MRDKLASLLSAIVSAARRAARERLPWRVALRRATVLARRGPRAFLHGMVAYAWPPTASAAVTPLAASAYEAWIGQNEATPLPEHSVDGIVSIVMPVCNTPRDFLEAALASVYAQSHQDWELCIHDDASDVPWVRPILESAASSDSRIKLSFGQSRGGISAASNAALAMASGRWIGFLDHDDVLDPCALALAARRLVSEQADLVYTDHDVLDLQGRRCNPFFKPDWNPDLFLSQMYVGHFVLVDRLLVSRLGGFRSEYDGAQDYDLVLRCAAEGIRIAHEPSILYHWRQHDGSTALNADSKPYAHHAGRAALQDFVQARVPGARVEDGPNAFCYDIRYPLPPESCASVIIPTRDGLALLRQCVETLEAKTEGMPYEIIVVDNGSRDEATLAWLERFSGRDGRRVIRADVAFNWSHLNNLAAREASGDVLVFLNNDTEITQPDWLLRLAENARRENAGVCGPLLLYADGTIQHAGVVVGMGGWADHVFKGMAPVHHQHLFASPVLRRNVLAVTGACMVVSRTVFDRLGGFDESFVVCGSDVDLCLRAHRDGLLNVYVPEARLVHHESKTRDPRHIPESDFVHSARAYSPYRMLGDPLYNRNLDPMSLVPALRPGR